MIREIEMLRRTSHRNVIELKDIVLDCDNICLVMEVGDRSLQDDIKKKIPFSTSDVKSIMSQLLDGVGHLHKNNIFHRDLKPANILMTKENVLKICDLGMARELNSPDGCYTTPVVTLWYRPLEILLGSRKYGPAIDIWSMGCIFYELLTLESLFPGTNELDQIKTICRVLSTPNETVWPGIKNMPLLRAIKLKNYSGRLKNFSLNYLQKNINF